MILLTLPFYVLYGLRAAYLIGHPEIEPYFDRAWLVAMRDAIAVLVVFWAAFLLCGPLASRSPGARTAYVLVATFSWWVSAAGITYGLGPVTSTISIAVVIGGVVQLLVLPQRRSAERHGVARVRREIQDDLLHLHAVGLDLTEVLGEPEPELHVIADQGPEQADRLANGVDQQAAVAPLEREGLHAQSDSSLLVGELGQQPAVTSHLFRLPLRKEQMHGDAGDLVLDHARERPGSDLPALRFHGRMIGPCVESSAADAREHRDSELASQP